MSLGAKYRALFLNYLSGWKLGLTSFSVLSLVEFHSLPIKKRKPFWVTAQNSPRNARLQNDQKECESSGLKWQESWFKRLHSPCSAEEIRLPSTHCYWVLFLIWFCFISLLGIGPSVLWCKASLLHLFKTHNKWS